MLERDGLQVFERGSLETQKSEEVPDIRLVGLSGAFAQLASEELLDRVLSQGRDFAA